MWKPCNHSYIMAVTKPYSVVRGGKPLLKDKQYDSISILLATKIQFSWREAYVYPNTCNLPLTNWFCWEIPSSKTSLSMTHNCLSPFLYWHISATMRSPCAICQVYSKLAWGSKFFPDVQIILKDLLASSCAIWKLNFFREMWHTRKQNIVKYFSPCSAGS